MNKKDFAVAQVIIPFSTIQRFKWVFLKFEFYLWWSLDESITYNLNVKVGNTNKKYNTIIKRIRNKYKNDK